MNINQLISDKLKILLEGGIDSSVFEIKLLIGHILGIEPKNVASSMELNRSQEKILDKMIQERLNHKPVDRIIGLKGFYKYDFIINDNVLSPRYDTEVLVEKAIELLGADTPTNVLELGVGSGCIILSILADLKKAHGVGVDISEAALAITDINAEHLAIGPSRIELIIADWFNNDIITKLDNYKPFDMIVSNPPYIASTEIDKLDEEVKNYDPLIALDGGANGLKDYDRIIELSKHLLKSQGFLLLEAGDKQQLEQIAEKGKFNGFQVWEILKDLSGNERCIILKK